MTTRRVSLVLVLAGVVVGCDPEHAGTTYPGTSVYMYHDNERSVTCWIYSVSYKGGISCLPDRELGK
jgi:hypothetical protein